MGLVTILRVVAVVSVGLPAGIFLGYRAGVQYALPEVSASSFVQLQKIIHVHYVRFMPPLVLTALLSSVFWLVMIRSQLRTPEFWCVAISTCGILVIAAATRAVNVPLNNQLMTWDTASPPPNLREIWAPWDRVNTLRSVEEERYRVRLGDYRILYEIEDQILRIMVVKIGHRRDVYRA